MLFGSDEDNNIEFLVTPFDWERLKGLIVGEKVNSENGSWSIMLYPQEYVLITHFPKSDMKSFSTWKDLVQYLK